LWTVTDVSGLYQTTRLNIPEESHLHIRRRENPKHHPELTMIIKPCSATFFSLFGHSNSSGKYMYRLF
jgi:hypothetical protein